jgi:hypothetical protein
MLTQDRIQFIETPVAAAGMSRFVFVGVMASAGIVFIRAAVFVGDGMTGAKAQAPEASDEQTGQEKDNGDDQQYLVFRRQ